MKTLALVLLAISLSSCAAVAPFCRLIGNEAFCGAVEDAASEAVKAE